MTEPLAKPKEKRRAKKNFLDLELIKFKYFP